MINNYRLTFQQFLQNPSGPYSAFFGRRSDIKSNLDKRFSDLVKKYGAFETKIYKNDKKEFLFHIKIPSEKYEKLFYDTVIRLRPISNSSLSDFTLMNYEINVYSNSPAFVFTYAYVFNKDGLFIEFLKGRISNKALTDRPKIKNPFEIYGFEKSLYFALSYIKLNSYHVKSKIQSMSESLNESSIRDKIIHSDDIMEKYNKLKEREQNKKKAEKGTVSKLKSDKKGRELNKKIEKKVRNIENGNKPNKKKRIDKLANEIVKSKKSTIKSKNKSRKKITEQRNNIIKPKYSTIKNKKK